jgi:DNA-binding FadR family transcriptional regulator
MADVSPDLGFSPARRRRSFEDVVDQIRAVMLDGRLEPGARLPNERELCAQFGVGRSTLREALRTLEAQGVIEVRLGVTGGIFAARPDASAAGSALAAMLQFGGATATEFAEFRATFEAENAAWAARRRTADDVETLTAIAAAAADLAARGRSWHDVVSVDVRFHEQVARATGNGIRVAILTALDGALRRVVDSIAPIATPAILEREARELHGIAEAIASRREAAAAERMHAHVAFFSELEVAEHRR